MPQVERKGFTLALSLHHIMIGGPLAGQVDHHQAQGLHQVPGVQQLTGWIVALWRRKLRLAWAWAI